MRREGGELNGLDCRCQDKPTFPFDEMNHRLFLALPGNPAANRLYNYIIQLTV